MIEALQNIGFVVKRRTEIKELSPFFLQRYSNLPADYLKFLNEFQLIQMRMITYGLIPLKILMRKSIMDSVGTSSK